MMNVLWWEAIRKKTSFHLNKIVLMMTKLEPGQGYGQD